MARASGSALYTNCLVLPDTADEEPGAVAAGPLAFLLHVSAQLYCMRNATDGYIPRSMVRRLVDWTGVAAERRDRPATAGPDGKTYYPVDSLYLASRLVDEGLWVPIADGFVIQGLLLSNPAQAEFDRMRIQGNLKAVSRRERVLENDPELSTLQAAIVGVSTTERPKRLWKRSSGEPTRENPHPHPHIHARARARAHVSSSGTSSSTLSLPESGDGEMELRETLSPERPEVPEPVNPVPGKRRKTGDSPPPKPPPHEKVLEDRDGGHSTKVEALIATTTPSGQVEQPIVDKNDILKRAVGNPRVQSFMDEVRRLDASLVVTMNPRAASAIKNCTAPPAYIARAYVDAKYRRWGDQWLWKNMSVWAVIDRLDAYDQAEVERVQASPVQQITAKRFTAMSNGYEPSEEGG